jgi:hypothetical protein
MKMRKLNVPWPRLLIVTNTNGKMAVAVAALKGNRRPTERTKLYHAPLLSAQLNQNPPAHPCSAIFDYFLSMLFLIKAQPARR